jgi:hypothetical protein
LGRECNDNYHSKQQHFKRGYGLPHQQLPFTKASES